VSLDNLLELFPPRTHPLTLVSDPDGLLADESMLAALNECGFTPLTESEPVLLRNRVESLKPWQVEKSVIIITSVALESLPYDLWQYGHRLQLSLHDYFPNLAYPLVQALTPYQRARLIACPPPQTRLGQQLSAEYILRHVFNLSLEHLDRPSALVAWLDQYHNGLAPLPPALLENLLVQLGKFPIYTSWPLQELLEEHTSFNEFLQTQWSQYVNKSMGDWGATSHYTIKPMANMLLSFEQDTALQDTLPRLVRSGSLAPLEIDELSTAPSWAMPALLVSQADRCPQRMAEISADLSERLDGLPSAARWEDWQPLARLWAELTLLRAETLDPQPASSFSSLRNRLDEAFTTWLGQRYTPLGAQRLPLPHHVHHVPHYLNYRREQGQEKIVLIVLDGLALMDWLLIRNAWQARHPNWHLAENLLLAQVPTITSISRQALVSGLRPADFTATIQTNSEESRQWETFWTRSGLPAEACAYVSADFRRDPMPAELTDPRLRLLCLVERTVDEIVHGSVLGNADLIATIRVWLDEKKTPQQLESAVSDLLGRGFNVFITSDHGHTEAIGVGQPNEGILAQTRGRRVRIYSDRNIALQTQDAFKPSLLWENDGLLPNDLYAILPGERGAFVPKNQPILTHGGISLDEVIVPFIEITHG
jgi:hypothetical protein